MIVPALVKTWAMMAPFDAKPNNGKQVDPVPVDVGEKWINVPDRVAGLIQSEIENAWLLFANEVKPDVWK